MNKLYVLIALLLASVCSYARPLISVPKSVTATDKSVVCQMMVITSKCVSDTGEMLTPKEFVLYNTNSSSVVIKKITYITQTRDFITAVIEYE